MKHENRTGEWLAVQLECSLSTVTKILGGRVPRGETLVKLAKLMGCQVEDLIPSEAKRRTAS